MKKKVGIDFHVFDGIYQGSRTYALELFSRVIEVSPDIDFFLFLDQIDSLYRYSNIFRAKNVNLIHMPYSNPIKRLCWQLPRLQNKYKLDLLHSQYIIPFPNCSKAIVTIHDVLFESHPQFFNKTFRLRSSLLMRWAARKSVHIFTSSANSKKEIVKRFRIKPEKVTVIYCAVDNERFYPGSDGEDIVRKAGLEPHKYILTVGRIEPRKNHITQIKAYAKLSKYDYPLVIIGQCDYGYNEVFDTVKQLKLTEHILFLNDVKDEDLPSFYRNAKLFLYPSFAEGFGIPVVEAMASGVPVITSNTTSLPEAVGNAGLLINPDDNEEIKISIEKVLNDEQLYQELRTKGLAQATIFDWKESAIKVRNEYLNYIE